MNHFFYLRNSMLFAVLMMSPHLHCQDFKELREVTISEVAQFEWSSTISKKDFEIVIPHAMSLIFHDHFKGLRFTGRWWGLLDYKYAGKYSEEIKLNLELQQDPKLIVKRSMDLSHVTVPSSLNVADSYSADGGSPLAMTSKSTRQENLTGQVLGSSQLTFSLLPDSQDQLPLYPVNEFTTSFKPIVGINYSEGPADIDADVSPDGISTRVGETKIKKNELDTTSYLLSLPPLGQAVEMMTRAAPLAAPVEVKFYTNLDWSKLHVFIKDRIFTFTNKKPAPSAPASVSGQLLPEIKVILHYLYKLKKVLRPSAYEESYGQILSSLTSLAKLMQEKKLNHLDAEVQNQYESVFFLYRNILLKEIEKDKQVSTYALYVHELCKHLDSCNQNFFQFDPGTPSSAIISLITRHISSLLEKSKLQIDKHQLANVDMLKKIIEDLFTQSFELSVQEVVGDADVGLLNQLDQFICSYHENRELLESGLQDHAESKLLYEQINLGMGFLRKIRE